MSNVSQILSTSTKPAPLSWVESLFGRMSAMYGKKFSDMWQGSDISTVKAIWAEEMGKLSNEELKRGYGALMTRDWPPSLPEYVKMCKPSIDPMNAYQEAVSGLQARSNGKQGKWSHPAIYWAAVPMAYDLSSQTYAQMKMRWDRALANSMEAGEWEQIPQVALALPAPGRAELSKQNAAKMLDELGAAGLLKANKESTFRYRKILQRLKDGDKTVTQYMRTEAEKGAAAHGYKA